MWFRSAIAPLMLLLVLSGPAAQGGGLVQRLPADGSWSRYFVELSFANQRRPELKFDAMGTLTVRFVGRATDGDEACRWMECDFDLVYKAGGEDRRLSFVIKALVPERSVTAEQNPLSQARTLVTRFDESLPPMSMDAAQFTELTSDGGELGWMRLCFDPLDFPATLQRRRDIDCQTGRLACAGRRGYLAERDGRRVRGAEIELPLEVFGRCLVWTHDTPPLGAAALELDYSPGGDRDERLQFRATFQDSGDGAISTLTDAQ